MKKAIYTAFLCSISILVSTLGLLIVDGKSANANGVPHEIVLTYLQGVSNWGPTTATGVVEVVPKQGDVSIKVVGLPSLSNESYNGWLINAKTGQALNVGHFNTDASETAKAQISMPSEIPDFGWNMFLLTVEPNGETPQHPGNKKSIGGYVTDLPESKPIPAQLPKTGGDTDVNVSYTNQPTPTGALLAHDQSKSNVNYLPYGIVALAVVGVGIFTGVRMRRG